MFENILQEIMSMEMGETATFKLSDDRFLFVDNWSAGDGDDFTSLELNSGEEEDGSYVLEKVLECGTYDFGDEEDVRSGVEYMLLCAKD